jgi:hypothetical protein
MPALTPNNEFIDTVMGQIVPTGATPGALYATDITQDLLVNVAQHTHTGADNLDGYQLGADSLDVASDLQLNNNNLGSSRSVEFVSQPTNINGPNDINALYDVNGDLWFNDGFGNQIRITENGLIIPSTIASLLNWTTATLTGTGSPLIIPNNSTYNCYSCYTTSATLPIILPLVATQSAGRFFMFNDAGNNAANNNITISVATGSTDLFNTGLTTFTIDSNGGFIAIYSIPSVSPNVWQIYSQNVFDNQTLQLDNGSNLNINNSQINLLGSSQLNLNSGSGFFGNSTFIDISTSTILGNANITTDTSSQFVYNNAAFTENGTDHTFTAGSVVTLTSSSDAYFQGPIVLGNLTGYPYPSIPSTPALYVNNGVISLLTSNALVANYPGAAASGSSGGITSHIAGGITSGADGGISLSGSTSDWITYANPRSQYINIPIIPNYLPSGNNSSPIYVVNPYTGKDGWSYSTLTSSTVQVLQSGRTGDQSGSPPPAFPPVWIPLGQLTDGAVFTSLTLTFELFSTASRTPSQPLNLSVYASSSGATTSIASQSLTSYTTAGVQTLVALVSPTVVVNNGITTYNAVITDEYDSVPSHSIGGNYFIQLTALMSNITSNQL